MKNVIALLCLTGMLVGCEAPEIQGQNIYQNQSEMESILKSCERLDKLGNLRDLRSQIHSQMGYLKALINQSAPEEQVRSLTHKIQKDAQNLNRIIGSKYSSISEIQSLFWDLSSSHLGLSPEAARYWKLADMKIDQIYSWNNETRNIWENLHLSLSENGGGFVSLSRPASLIEICQLQEAMVIVVRAEFVHKQESKVVFYRLLSEPRGRL